MVYDDDKDDRHNERIRLDDKSWIDDGEDREADQLDGLLRSETLDLRRSTKNRLSVKLPDGKSPRGKRR